MKPNSEIARECMADTRLTSSGKEVFEFYEDELDAFAAAIIAANEAQSGQNNTCQLPTTRQALAALEKQQRDERLYRKAHNL